MGKLLCDFNCSRFCERNFLLENGQHWIAIRKRVLPSIQDVQELLFWHDLVKAANERSLQLCIKYETFKKGLLNEGGASVGDRLVTVEIVE